MATQPKSYKKNGYIYTESSPGSNKYQNFTAAKPTVKKVRDESRADKAVVAAKKAFPKGLADRQSTQVKSSATPVSDYRNTPKAKISATPASDYRSTPKAKLTNRQGGMDTGNVMKKSYPSRQGGMDTGNVSSKKSIVGSIIDRVTQPPKKLNPASEKILADARAEITPVITTLAGAGIVKKFGKGIIKAFAKKPKAKADDVGRPIEELFKRGKGTPRVKPSPSRPFPKGKGTYRGKRTPGTYTAN